MMQISNTIRRLLAAYGVAMSDAEMAEYVHLSFFAEIGKAIASAITINETLKVVMSQIGTIFAPLNWSLLLRNPKTGELTFKLVIGSGVEKLQGMTIPKGKGIAGWIAETGQSIILKDVTNDKRFDPSMDQLVGFKTRSIIGVPLKTKNKVFGVIELVNKLNGGSFSPLELKTLVTIADFAAIAIEKACYYQALKKIALLDPLTGVNNRRNMVRYIEREIDRCHRHDTVLSVLMADIDHFKEINDNFGHTVGDHVLRHFAHVLTANLRKIDVICRYGGDEFVAIMPDTDSEQATAARARIIAALENDEPKAPVAYRLSIGTYSGQPESLQEIFKSADLDMYREKSSKIEAEIENLPQHLHDLINEEEQSGGNGGGER